MDQLLRAMEPANATPRTNSLAKPRAARTQRPTLEETRRAAEGAGGQESQIRCLADRECLRVVAVWRVCARITMSHYVNLAHSLYLFSFFEYAYDYKAL